MRKATITLTINPEVYDQAQIKFPKQLSSMVEEYLRSIIDYEEMRLPKDFSEIKEELDKAIKEEAEAKRKRQFLQSKAKSAETELDKKEEYRLKMEHEMLKRDNPLRYL